MFKATSKTVLSETLTVEILGLHATVKHNYPDYTNSFLGPGKPRKTLALWRGTKLLSEKDGSSAFHQLLICGLPAAFVTSLNIENKTNIEIQMLFYSKEMAYSKISILS